MTLTRRGVRSRLSIQHATGGNDGRIQTTPYRNP
jgi:hypothetical protein